MRSVIWFASGLLAVGLCACHRTPGGSPQASSSSQAPALELSAAPLESAAPASSEDDDNGPDPGASASSRGFINPVPSALPPRSVKFHGSYKIAAKAMQSWVHLYPDDRSPYLGYIRAGMVVDRSQEPIRTRRCPKGWYEVLPRGYVCIGNRMTLDLDDPTVVASWKKAKRGDPLPYQYVRPQGSQAFLYFKLPATKDQQRTEEFDYKVHRAAMPTGKIPNVEQLGEPEPIPEFLQGSKELPKPYGATKRLRYNVHEGPANPGVSLALLSVHDHEDRLFGLTTELNLIAIDRTNIVKPIIRHGGPVQGLPAGIVRTTKANRYKMGPLGQPVRDGQYAQYETVTLTGKIRQDLCETTDGTWIQGGTFLRIGPSSTLPTFATGQQKWIDVSVENQVLVAYVGPQPIYVAQVSTGLGGTGDPEKSFATVRGTFTIKSKHVTATMRGNAHVEEYEIADVPYVQYFHEGYALHAAFWHDDFGHPHSHGCVNLTPIDAAWLFEWTEPVVPPEWHGANATNDSPGTIVYVHP